MFGLAWKKHNGEIVYCSSTRSNAWSADLNSIAVMVQKSTVEKIIHGLRADGFEHKYGGELIILPLEMACKEPVHVPHKAEKHGYCILLPDGKYYAGKQVPDCAYKSRQVNSVFRATVFKTEQKAKTVLDIIIALLEEAIKEHEENKLHGRYNNYDYYSNLQDLYKRSTITLK